MDISVNIEDLSVLLLIAVGMYLSMALISFLNRKVEGASFYTGLLLSASIYSLGYYFELRSNNIIAIFNWLRFEYFGISVMPSLWLLFAVKYSGNERLIKGWRLFLIWSIPVITFLSVNTNDLHHLFYKSIDIRNIGGLSIASMVKGPFYWLHVIYYNIAFLIGNILMLNSFMKSRDMYRRRFLLLFVGAVIPWVLITIYLLGGSPMDIDLAPFGFVIAGAIYIYNIFRFKTFDFLSEARLDVFTHLDEGILIFNSDNKLVDMNGSAIQSVGSLELLKGMTLEKVLETISIDIKHSEDESLGEIQGVYKVIDKEKWLEINSLAVKDENEVYRGRIVIIKDITDTIKNQEEINYLSVHDKLTGLYNRSFFEEELRRLDTPKNLPFSIIIADLNGLKLANDAFGHLVGDELLKKTAEVLKSECGSNDIIARMGGDEFTILLPNTTAKEVEDIINRVNAATSRIKVDPVILSISMGWKTKEDMREKIEDIFKKAEDDMYRRKLFESPSIRSKTVGVILNTLYQKNTIEEQHSHRVSALCELVGQELALNEAEIRELKLTGSLHDIGKIAIDEKIINKNGRLNEFEWSEIKRHSEIGYRILSSVNYLSEVAEYVLAHHERWDGGGYPKGLKGEEIPIYSRIVSIADAYDTMVTIRPYRVVVSKEDALMEITKNAGTQFDPILSKVFVDLVNKEYLTEGKLNL